MQNFNEVDAAFDWKCALNALKTSAGISPKSCQIPMSKVSVCRSRSHGGNGRLGGGGEPVGGRPWILVRKGIVRY